MIRLLVVLLVTTTVAHAQTYAPAKRVAHLADAIAGLDALGDAGKRAFELAVHEAVRRTCRPGSRPAPTACMIDVARQLCAKHATLGARCLAVADVVLTNQHAEKALLDEPTRMRIVAGSADYHAGVVAALEARYAVLAAELALMAPDGTLAERIDRLCVARDREVRPCPPGETSCVGTIAYQRCAAGLVWITSGGAR